MKTNRLYIFAIAAIFSCSVRAHTPLEEAPDTLLKIDTPSRLVITESPEGSVITVTGIDGEETFETSVTAEYPKNSSVSSSQKIKSGSQFEFPGVKNSSTGWKCYVDGVTLGLSNPSSLAPEKGLQWSKSIEVGWLDCFAVGYSWRNIALTLGLGFDWRNYKITTTDKYLVVTPQKGIEWASAATLPEGSRLQNSRLKVFSLQLPLLLRAKIPGSSLRLKLGPIFNFNTHASVKTNYIDSGGNKCEFFCEDLNQRRFTVDLFGSLSISNIVGVFVRYSPMKVMDASDGLNFRPLTVGFAFGI